MTFKQVLKYVVMPITFLLGIITYLLGSNRKLQSQVDDKDWELKKDEIVDEQSKIDEKASTSLNRYYELLAKYKSKRNVVRGSTDSGGDGDSGSTEAD